MGWQEELFNDIKSGKPISDETPRLAKMGVSSGKLAGATFLGVGEILAVFPGINTFAYGFRNGFYARLSGIKQQAKQKAPPPEAEPPPSPGAQPAFA